MTKLLALHWGLIKQVITLTGTGKSTTGHADPVAASAAISAVSATSTATRQRGHARTSGRISSGRSSTPRGRGGNG